MQIQPIITKIINWKSSRRVKQESRDSNASMNRVDYDKAQPMEGNQMQIDHQVENETPTADSVCWLKNTAVDRILRTF